MSTMPEHCAKAENNEFLADQLDNPFWDWAVTAVFYTAVHYVEAYFASRVPARHLPNHTIRDNYIHHDRTLNVIHDDYRQLYDESRSARYDAGMTFTQADVGIAKGCLERIKKVVLPLL